MQILKIAQAYDVLGYHNMADRITKVAVTDHDLARFYGFTQLPGQYSMPLGHEEDDPVSSSKMEHMLFLKQEFIKGIIIQIKKELFHAIKILRESKYNTKEFILDNISHKLGIPESESKKYDQEIQDIVNNTLSQIYDTINQLDDNPKRGMEKAIPLFLNEAIWPGAQYGGKKWAKIANAGIKLLGAKKPEDLQTYIDHIINISHNTGSLIADFDSAEPLWLEKFLNEKSNSRQINYPIPEAGILQEYRHQDRKITDPKDIDAPEDLAFYVNRYIDDSIKHIAEITMAEMSQKIPEGYELYQSPEVHQAIIQRIGEFFDKNIPIIVQIARRHAMNAKDFVVSKSPREFMNIFFLNLKTSKEYRIDYMTSDMQYPNALARLSEIAIKSHQPIGATIIGRARDLRDAIQDEMQSMD